MDGGFLNFFFINPTFTIHYHRYEAPAPRNDDVDYDALYDDAFAQIGNRHLLRINASLAREMTRANAYNHFLNTLLGFEATDHSNEEPDHKDAPPFITPASTARANVCIDFGFEPTEASE